MPELCKISVHDLKRKKDFSQYLAIKPPCFMKYVRVRISDKKCLSFRKLRRALFSYYLRFEIHLCDFLFLTTWFLKSLVELVEIPCKVHVFK